MAIGLAGIVALLALLALLAIIAKLICWWRTERFPSNSRVVITDQDQPGAPRRLPLHRVSATLFTCWSEQRRVDGLVLRATPNGAEILYQRHLSPTLMHLMRGESLVELCQQNPRRIVSWRWGETLEDRELQREYVLVRDIG